MRTELGSEKLQCIILRGVQGSGKSRWAEIIARASPIGARIVSADNLFIQPDGSWLWQPNEIGRAHSLCLLDALDCFQMGEQHIVVDNTNIAAADIAPYYALALAFDYEPVIQEVGTPEFFEHYFARQTHGVPRDVFDRACEGFVNRSDFAPWWVWRKGS